MNFRFPIALLLGASVMATPGLLAGQAVAVSPSGTTTQEQAAPSIAPEDQATKEQLNKLFDVMRIRDQMQSMQKIIPSAVESQLKGQMQTMMAQNPSGPQLTATQRDQLDQLMHKYMEKAMNLYPVDEMLADMTGLYQHYLTREDVDAMIAFYGSPAGQHVLDAQPKIAREYMPLVMSRMSERSKALTAEMMKDAAVLKESSGETQPTKK